MNASFSFLSYGKLYAVSVAFIPYFVENLKYMVSNKAALTNFYRLSASNSIDSLSS